MKYFIFLIFFMLLLAGCVYYNTFFNAEQYFESAQKEALSKDGSPSRNAVQNYNKAMKKCGIILTDYKNSNWADDALFMMAQCLYYKQKYVQAKENFEEVIKFYPDTDFAERSHIYLAKCEFQMGRYEKAYSRLRDYLVVSSSKHYLVEATNLLAEFYLENEVFSQAEYYYQKIIDNYPSSELYEDAFFSLGLLYHRNKKYELSNQVFENFLKIRADKKMKLDARYYIIYNYLLADDYQTALDEISSLMRKEYRDYEMAAILILKARALAKAGDTEQADIIFEQIINDNDKTLIAAECYFWRAEMHFRMLNNYEQAIEFYNNVRTQNASSPYIEDAVSHSAVASQIVQYNTDRADIELRQLISEQMKLAEYYLEVLALPDSAMAVYDKIINYKGTLQAKLDSLHTALVLLQTAALDDSAQVMDFRNDTLSDSTLTPADSLFTKEDSLAHEEQGPVIVLQDTTEVIESQKPEAIVPTRMDTLQNKISQLHSEIELYNIEFIPYVKFVKLWLYKNVYQDSAAAQQFFDEFIASYPDNKYSHAARMLIQNKNVEFISYENQQQRLQLNAALDQLFTKPDSARIILQDIAADSTSLYYQKAIYSLGYLHYHVRDDTTAARPYFEEILSWDEGQEYKEKISDLFADGCFLRLDRLPYLVEMEERAAQEAARLEEANSDSLEDELIIELEEIDESAPKNEASSTPVSPRQKKP